MPTVTEQTLTVHNLYAMRDNIGLSRSECKQPPRHRSLFEWGKAQQAYYLNNLTGGITSPPKVFIYEPFTDSSKAAVLDGRQRLKAIFSYLDGNYPLGETAPDGWAGKTTSSYRQQPLISQTHSCAHPAEPASSTPPPTGKPPSPPTRKSVDTLAKR